MTAKIKTLTFSGIRTIDVTVEVKLSSGIVTFNIVGLPDKAVNEAKERIRSCFHSLGLSFPAKRLTINLSPADLSKEGSYLDLPMALGLLVEMDIISQRSIDNYIVVGELALDASLNPIGGILPLALGAAERNLGLLCPRSNSREALWADESLDVLGVDNLLTLINHLNGRCVIEKPLLQRRIRDNNSSNNNNGNNLKYIRGQQQAKRALEIAAAGGHNMLMMGPPGAGKSLLARCLMGILPPMTSEDMLETNIINSLAGKLTNGELLTSRPFLDPHHSSSMVSLVGGGGKPKPGQISLAHNGVLFLDELAEFPRQLLDALRQPLETGSISIARASGDITYPALFQLIAAMNPCRCGYYGDGDRECRRAPRCAEEYQSKLSGPLLDRFDMFVDVPKVDIFNGVEGGDSSEEIALRVSKARDMQKRRKEEMDRETKKEEEINKEEEREEKEVKENRYLFNYGRNNYLNARATVDIMNRYMVLDGESKEMLKKANAIYNFSMRSYDRIRKLSRTIADLSNSENILPSHVAEALMFKESDFLVGRR